MDDFNVSALHESKNEWGSRLVTILTPLIIEGYKSILDESIKLCKENHENDKYLMTFQNLISRIPKWNPQIIETERKRICAKSSCTYLEELVACVHIIQLKILTAMRVGQKQKKIDIKIMKLDDFIHKTYINVARKVYKNVYLFEVNVPPLQTQKNYRELEIIVQECILNTIRESIPVEDILKAYMDETVEEEVVEEVSEKVVQEPIYEPVPPQTTQIQAQPQTSQVQTQIQAQQQPPSTIVGGTSLTFNDVDYVKTEDGKIDNVMAPKTLERLDEISDKRYQERKQFENDEDDDDENMKITISNESFDLDNVDRVEEPSLSLIPDLLMDDVEILE
jgi:hypothetical protein